MVPLSTGTVNGDSTLPQLETALDTSSMLEAFRTHLRPAGEVEYGIRSCRLSRIRYREGFRCIMQYTLSIVEPGTGDRRDLQVSGTIYAKSGKAERRYHKLLTEEPLRQIPESLRTFEPVGLIPETGMLVQVFPYDNRLPSLPLLAAGPPPDLEPLLTSRYGSGGWIPEAWSAETVRYRGHLGAVLRYAGSARNTTTGEEAASNAYVKVYRNDSGEQTFRLLEDLRRVCDENRESFTVVAPLVYLNEHRALVLEEAPGIPLEDVLLEGHSMVEVMRKVARDLASFNRLDLVPERHHTLADQVFSLERSGKLLKWACPDLSAEIDTIIATVSGSLEDVPPRPTHRDLKTDHIFRDGDRTVFIDLDSFAGADPVLDPAQLIARLATMPDLLPMPRSRARIVSQAFAEEYFAHVPESWRARLPLHYSAALLEIAQGFFRRQEPGWPRKIKALVREAGKAIESHL